MNILFASILVFSSVVIAYNRQANAVSKVSIKITK
tara:strand:- start:814 stop:918 length:105 start_codon:yes stop_codon:yes gene_type:complete